MPEHRERLCVPIEVEMVPLYREPAWSARLRRAQRREERRRRRQSSTRRRRILLRLLNRAPASRQGEHRS